MRIDKLMINNQCCCVDALLGHGIHKEELLLNLQASRDLYVGNTQMISSIFQGSWFIFNRTYKILIHYLNYISGTNLDLVYFICA